MVKLRDWSLDCKELDVEFLSNDDSYIYYTKDGFTFKSSRQNWPPNSVQIRQCLDPVEYFKFLVKNKHGDFYDLSKTVFTGVDKHVTAKCKIHGEFTTSARNLLNKYDCPKCGRQRSAQAKYLNTEEFIKRAKEIFGERYDYSKAEYTTSLTKVQIICNKHGLFSIAPESHLQGRGCALCGRDKISALRAKSEEKAISDLVSIHSGKYDYSLVKYTGDKYKIKIICNNHGIFEQTYSNHKIGQGCPICAKEFNPRFKSGFVKSGENKNYASLYLIKCFSLDEEFYKIGITTKPLKTRFGGHSTLPYNYELLHLFVAEPGAIWDLETLLHKTYKDVKYLPNKEFGGRYECFSFIDIQEYTKLLNCIA